MKLLVANGYTNLGVSSSIEVIDLSSTNTRCKNLANYPHTDFTSFGFLDPTGKPLICGGLFYTNQCFSYEKDAWSNDSSLNFPRAFSSLAMSEWQNGLRQVLVTGSSLPKVFNAEKLTANGWETMPTPLPFFFSKHCSVFLNNTTAMIIGGMANGSLSSKVVFLNVNTEEWYMGPNMHLGRIHAACGRIVKDGKLVPIVVGGENTGYSLNNVVEIYDESTDTWQYGPSFPSVISRSALVEDPNGGVLIVAGQTTSQYVKSIWILRNLLPGNLIKYKYWIFGSWKYFSFSLKKFIVLKNIK